MIEVALIVAMVAYVSSPLWLAWLRGRRACPSCPHRMREHIGRRYSCLADGPDGSLWCPCKGRP